MESISAGELHQKIEVLSEAQCQAIIKESKAELGLDWYGVSCLSSLIAKKVYELTGIEL